MVSLPGNQVAKHSDSRLARRSGGRAIMWPGIQVDRQSFGQAVS